jgi:ribose transport system substrate-binding protein
MKNAKFLTLLATFSVAVVGLAACAGTPAPADTSSAAPKKDITIGFVNANNLEFHTCLQKGIEAAADEQGVTLKVVNSAGDPVKEQTNVEDLLAQVPTALILQTVNVDSLSQAVAKANAATVPIYLTSVLGAEKDKVLGATVAAIPVTSGMLAEWTNTDAAGADANVAIIAGAPGAASDLFVQGYQDKLDSNLTVVFNQPGMYNRGKAQEVTENLLQSNPDTQYIYVPNEEMAFGVLEALKAADRTDIKIVANGGTENGLAAVEDGSFAVMTSESAYDIGHLALENAVKLLEGDTSVEKISTVEPVLVTKDTIDDAHPYCG